MFHIVTSKAEPYGDAAEMIRDGFLRFSSEVQISDVSRFYLDAVADGGVVFFLTNSERVHEIVCGSASDRVFVFNSPFLRGCRLKSDIQNRLGLAGVCVPRLAAGLDATSPELRRALDPLGYPLYLKSECHARGVHRVADAVGVDDALQAIGASGSWYAEAALDAPDCLASKIYWVDRLCLSRDGEPEPSREIAESARVIAECLELDVFSADFITREGEHWCIDVNAAPALFGSKEARAAFVRQVQSLSPSG